jgi:metal-dependent hydrolase (beta-lactamase superfamily II)
MMQKCPGCGHSNYLRTVRYGMPDEPVDESKFVLGGCCLSGMDPLTVCIKCDWEGDFKENAALSVFE